MPRKASSGQQVDNKASTWWSLGADGAVLGRCSRCADGLTRNAGLDVVAVPAMAATEALVYDWSGNFLLVAEDFRIVASRDYAPAFVRDSVALRVSGQFTVAVPVPAASIRKLAITAGTQR